LSEKYEKAPIVKPKKPPNAKGIEQKNDDEV